MGLRIEDRHHVGRIFRRAVQRTTGVHSRLAPIRRDQVMQVLVGRGPVPGGNHNVAFDPRWTRRLALRQFALGHAIGPVAEILVRHAAKLAGDTVGHHLAGLAGRDAADPGVCAAVELAELRRDGARRFLAKLMTSDAVGVVHALDPGLARDALRNVGVSAEVLGRRNFHHRVPVDRRVVVRRRFRIGRHHRGVIDGLARLGDQLR